MLTSPSPSCLQLKPAMKVTSRRQWLAINDVNSSHFSVVHPLNASTGSDDDKQPVVDQSLATLGVPVNAGSTTFATSDKVPSNNKSASCRRSTLLTNQTSAVAVSNRTVESTSSNKSCTSGVKHLGSRKMVGVNREQKTIKKHEETGRLNKVAPSPGIFKIEIQVPSTASSTTGASTGSSSTHEIPDVNGDDNGARTIRLRFFSEKNVASDPYLLLPPYVK